MRRFLTFSTAAIIALAGAVSTMSPAAAAEPTTATATHVSVTLSEMSIKLSVATIPAGPVIFDITNAGAAEHELVVLKTDIAEGALPDNEEEVGKAAEVGNAGEIDPVPPGATLSLSLTLGPGKYLLVCNKPGHHGAGMHAALTVTTSVGVTEKEMSIGLTQKFAIAGPVTFTVTNAGAAMHELAVLKTDLAEGSIPSRADDPSKAQETENVGEAEDIEPGMTKTFTATLDPGKYVLICNQPGHYAAGMHVSFTVLPTLPRAVAAAIDAALAAHGVEDLEAREALVNVKALLTAPGILVTDADRDAIEAGILPRAVGAGGGLRY
jgi:uncharacterized cupredoxin-like copper-binding protein